MPGKQAKVLAPQMLRRTSNAPFPARDRVMILLSVKAGLRACEIARPARMVNGPRRARQGRRRSCDPRRDRKKARRPAHTHSS
jgi:hypothetical protein